MSFVTRCPACSTMFKVVADQLRVSDGWVRCGQCDEVFDANIHLQADEAVYRDVDESTRFSDAESLGDASLLVDDPSEAATAIVGLDFPTEPYVQNGRIGSSSVGKSLQPDVPGVQRDPILDHDPHQSLVPEGASASERVITQEPRWDSMPTDLSRGPADEVSAPRFPPIALPKFELNTGDASDAQPERATFMRSQSVPSTKSSLAIRVVSSLVALAFLGLLLGQVSIHDRDRLAAKAPAFKPLLQMICELAACQLGLPREIESVVIYSSSFVKIKAEVYKLNVTLKNTASTELAIPSLELTLTDSQDQAIVRRVIAATEIDALKNSALVTGSDLSVSVPVSVKLPSNSERVSGYRLLAFYP